MTYLEGKRKSYAKHDLARERPPRELLSRLIDEYGVAQVLNPRSPSFKAKGLGVESLTKEEAIRLVDEEPNLLRRPLVVFGKKALFGFRESEWDEEL